MDVLIEDDLDPAVAESVGQSEDAGGVLVRVVTVTEEHPRRIRHRADPPAGDSSATAHCNYLAHEACRPTWDGPAGGATPPPKMVRCSAHLRGSPGDRLAHSGRIDNKGLAFLADDTGLGNRGFRRVQGERSRRDPIWHRERAA